MLKQTIETLKQLLFDIHENGIESEIDPRVNFFAYIDKLDEPEQEKIMNTPINIESNASKSIQNRSASSEALLAFGQKLVQNPRRTLTVAQALQGGDTATPCAKVLQIYLWEFLIENEPSLVEEIPIDVSKAADQLGYYLLEKPASASQAKMTQTNRLTMFAGAPRVMGTIEEEPSVDEDDIDLSDSDKAGYKPTQ